MLTVAKMITSSLCEVPYMIKIIEQLPDDYNYIIARTNTPDEVGQFKDCIRDDKRNIFFMLSDEAGVVPYFLDELHLVFRTYSKKGLIDNKKIFAIPCGYSCGYSGYFGKLETGIYEMEKPKCPLAGRHYDIFFSGNHESRGECVSRLLDIKDKFISFIKTYHGFAHGLELGEYYRLMQDSKIAIVPVGVNIPESFRYFEAFESGCIVITNFPVNDGNYFNWFYEGSPAVYLDNWDELTVDLIEDLLQEESLKSYDIKNKYYFEKNISIKGVSEYIRHILWST